MKILEILKKRWDIQNTFQTISGQENSEELMLGNPHSRTDRPPEASVFQAYLLGNHC